MKPEDIKPGILVKTSPGLNPTTGMIVDPRFLAQRKPNQLAKIYSPVAGHGGDVWWLVHEGATTYKNDKGEEMLDKTFVAPYAFTEFMPFKK